MEKFDGRPKGKTRRALEVAAAGMAVMAGADAAAADKGTHLPDKDVASHAGSPSKADISNVEGGVVKPGQFKRWSSMLAKGLQDNDTESIDTRKEVAPGESWMEQNPKKIESMANKILADNGINLRLHVDAVVFKLSKSSYYTIGYSYALDKDGKVLEPSVMKANIPLHQDPNISPEALEQTLKRYFFDIFGIY